MTTYQKDANLKAVFTPEASSAVGAAQAGLEIGGGSEQALLCACCDTSEEVLDLLKADQFFFGNCTRPSICRDICLCLTATSQHTLRFYIL